MTPVAIRAARRFAFYDLPAGHKGHVAPTPYLGGAALIGGFALALLGLGDLRRTAPIVGGAVVLLVVGTIDDRRTLSPQLRVAIEFCLSALLTAAGLGWQLGAGPVIDLLVNGIWVVAVVNAFNLFDNMDGAATSMALVVACAVCVLGLLGDRSWVAIGSAVLCGACLGFMPHNLSRPARIFLGDGGSLPLGFVIAALVPAGLRSAEPSLLALLTGLLLVGIPALDTSLVIVSRRRRGVSILTGGQDHLTHRTHQRMRTAWRVALVLAGTQAVLCALVILATRESSQAPVYVVLGFVVCAVAAIVALEEGRVGVIAPVERAGDARPLTPSPRPGIARHLPVIGLGLIGIGAGLSPIFSGYYGVGVWVSLGLIVVVAAATAMVVRPPRFTRPVTLAFAGLAGLGVWSLASSAWAQAIEKTTVDGNLWLVYAALFLLTVVLLRRRRHAFVLLAALGLGVTVVAVSVLTRMLGSDPASLFVAGRLNAPLGYINGEGCVFAMGCWLSLAVAERRQAALAGAGAAGTVALALLALLSQSRGTAIATAAALVVGLVAMPGARRRLIALAFVACGIAAAAGSVTGVYSASHGALVPASAAHAAAIAILLSAAVTGAAWGIAVATARAVMRRGERSSLLLRRLATALAAAVIAVPVLAALVRLPSIERTVRTQWHAFVHVSDTSSSAGATQTRLFTGAGNRYDYWRIAWNVFVAQPVEGVGAGNYTAAYYRQRRTGEAVQNPHSLELQTLSELGLVGGALLALLLAGLIIGAAGLRSAAKRSIDARTMLVAAGGMAMVWFVDTSGDWMHLIPGVTAIGIAAFAVLCTGGGLFARRVGNGGEQTELARPTRGRRMPMLVARTALAFVLALTGASLLRSGLTQRYLDDAKGELVSHPSAALTDAERALRLDSANLDAYYVKAAAQARFDQAAAARSTLLAAGREDPQNFVTWALLGDLEVRLRNFGAARKFYRLAHVLDPHDPALSAIAASPQSELSGAASH